MVRCDLGGCGDSGDAAAYYCHLGVENIDGGHGLCATTPARRHTSCDQRVNPLLQMPYPLCADHYPRSTVYCPAICVLYMSSNPEM